MDAVTVSRVDDVIVVVVRGVVGASRAAAIQEAVADELDGWAARAMVLDMRASVITLTDAEWVAAGDNYVMQPVAMLLPPGNRENGRAYCKMMAARGRERLLFSDFSQAVRWCARRRHPLGVGVGLRREAQAHPRSLA